MGRTRRIARGQKCVEEGCNRKQFARGLCEQAYLASRVLQNLVNGRICQSTGCNKGQHARGYCRYHWDKFCRASGSSSRECSVDGCNALHVARGYCRKHYDALPERQAKRLAATRATNARKRLAVADPRGGVA